MVYATYLDLFVLTLMLTSYTQVSNTSISMSVLRIIPLLVKN